MLNVYRSNRTERLAEALVAVLKGRCPAPCEPEWICVQSGEMRTWLQMRLCAELGIVANTRIAFPRDLVERLLSAVLGAQAPDPLPFRRECLVWSIMAVLPELLHKKELAPLRDYLAEDGRGLKRFLLSEKIAHLFDEYALYRPQTVLG